MATYNHHIPRRTLNHQSPILALNQWQIDKPQLLVKRVYKQAGLDSYLSTTILHAEFAREPDRCNHNTNYPTDIIGVKL